jgi:hypothetical protein
MFLGSLVWHWELLFQKNWFCLLALTLHALKLYYWKIDALVRILVKIISRLFRYPEEQ